VPVESQGRETLMAGFDILILDDEENWRADLKYILEEEGYSVQVASSYSEAKKALASQTFRLLIVDIILRPTNPADRSGLQLLREARESPRSVGLIAISGYDVPEVVEEFGPQDFFDKRCLDTQKLRERVRELVQGTVLVVEDEDNWVEVYQDILTEEGFSVRVARDFGRALGELRRGFFRAVILDLCLGSRGGSNLYGVQLLESVSDAGIPVLIITGYATPKLVKEIYREYGVFSIGEKSTFDSDEFRKLIKEAVETGRGMLPPSLSSEERIRRERRLQELVDAILHERELPDVQSLRRQLERHRSNLRMLKELEAAKGLDAKADLSLMNQIEYEEQEIARLQDQLRRLGL
jgi:DNA-binding NtrC family response regulator